MITQKNENTQIEESKFFKSMKTKIISWFTRKMIAFYIITAIVTIALFMGKIDMWVFKEILTWTMVALVAGNVGEWFAMKKKQ